MIFHCSPHFLENFSERSSPADTNTTTLSIADNDGDDQGRNKKNAEKEKDCEWVLERSNAKEEREHELLKFEASQQQMRTCDYCQRESAVYRSNWLENPEVYCSHTCRANGDQRYAGERARFYKHSGGKKKLLTKRSRDLILSSQRDNAEEFSSQNERSEQEATFHASFQHTQADHMSKHAKVIKAWHHKREGLQIKGKQKKRKAFHDILIEHEAAKREMEDTAERKRHKCMYLSKHSMETVVTYFLCIHTMSWEACALTRERRKKHCSGHQGWQSIYNPADGNCMLYALAQGTGVSIGTFRNRFVKALLRFRHNECTDIKMSSFLDSSILKLLVPGSWGNIAMLRWAAWLLPDMLPHGVAIVEENSPLQDVSISNQHQHPLTINFEEFVDRYAGGSRPCTILYSNDHFSLLLPSDTKRRKIALRPSTPATSKTRCLPRASEAHDRRDYVQEYGLITTNLDYIEDETFLCDTFEDPDDRTDRRLDMVRDRTALLVQSLEDLLSPKAKIIQYAKDAATRLLQVITTDKREWSLPEIMFDFDAMETIIFWKNMEDRYYHYRHYSNNCRVVNMEDEEKMEAGAVPRSSCDGLTELDTSPEGQVLGSWWRPRSRKVWSSSILAQSVQFETGASHCQSLKRPKTWGPELPEDPIETSQRCLSSDNHYKRTVAVMSGEVEKARRRPLKRRISVIEMPISASIAGPSSGSIQSLALDVKQLSSASQFACDHEHDAECASASDRNQAVIGHRLWRCNDGEYARHEEENVNTMTQTPQENVPVDWYDSELPPQEFPENFNVNFCDGGSMQLPWHVREEMLKQFGRLDKLDDLHRHLIPCVINLPASFTQPWTAESQQGSHQLVVILCCLCLIFFQSLGRIL